MEISQHVLQDRQNIIPLTGFLPNAQIRHRPGTFFGVYPAEHAEAYPYVSTGRLRDPKAVQMYQLFSSREIHFVFKTFRTYLFLVTWLICIFFQKYVKRGFDLLIILGGLPFVLPFMLFVAMVVKLDSPGPVIFRQQRVGKWGRTFTCYKFRSMCVDAEKRKAGLLDINEADGVVFKLRHDPRVTRVGRFIRKASIDELPQIFNVLKGEMSLIGPRPPVPGEVEQYTFDVYQRLNAIPGITGLQQVSGRSLVSFQRWVELDIEYIRTQCLKKDVEILIKTIPAVLSSRGAY